MLSSAEVSKLIDIGVVGGGVLLAVSGAAVVRGLFVWNESSSEDRRPGEVVGDFWGDFSLVF